MELFCDKRPCDTWDTFPVKSDMDASIVLIVSKECISDNENWWDSEASGDDGEFGGCKGL